jgi:adenylate kinase
LFETLAMRIIFIGPPGSGKGTQAKLLQQHLGLTVIGTGELLRAAVKAATPTGKKAESFMNSGKLVPDELVNDIVDDYFHGPNPPQKFLLDGYPRTVAQAEFLKTTLADCNLNIDKVLLFDVAEDELIRRMNARRLAENRADDDEATIRKRLDTYRQQTAPLVDHYRRQGLLAVIAATGDVGAIHKQTLSHLT